MAVSRSYPRHLVRFCEKEKKSIKRPLFPFTSSVALVAMSQGFPRVPKGYHRLPKVTKVYHMLPKVSAGYYFNRFPKWISPLFSLILPVLTDHYIKTSDGGL